MAISFKYRPIANPASYSNQEPHFKVLGLHCGRKSNLKPIILAIFLVQIANIFFFLVVAPWVAHQTHRRDKYDDLNEYKLTKTFKDRNPLLYINDTTDPTVDIFSTSQGIVSISKDWARSRQLPPSEQSPINPNDEIYQVSLFHQLHCLNMIKKHLLEPQDGENFALHTEAFQHSFHCIDWIRQGLICNSDITLDTTNDFWSFGHNTEHKCRDSKAIIEWVEANRFKELGETLQKLYPDRLAKMAANH